MWNESDAADCPECGAAVRVRRPFPGQQFPCRECGTLLEVVRRTPLSLDICDLEEDDPVAEMRERRRQERERRRSTSPQHLAEDRY